MVVQTCAEGRKERKTKIQGIFFTAQKTLSRPVNRRMPHNRVHYTVYSAEAVRSCCALSISNLASYFSTEGCLHI